MANCDWLRRNFAGPLFSVIDHGPLRKKQKHFKAIFQSETVKLTKKPCTKANPKKNTQKVSFTIQKIQFLGTRLYLMRLTKTKRAKLQRFKTAKKNTECHIINFLLTSLARSVQRNIVARSFLYRPRPTDSVCTKKTSVRYFSVQTSRSVNKKLIMQRVWLT